MFVFHVALPSPTTLPVDRILLFAETEAVTTSVLKEYYVTQLLAEDTVLARLAAEGVTPGDSLKRFVLSDLEELLHALQGITLLDNYRPSVSRSLRFAAYQASLEVIVAAKDASAMLKAMISHFRTFGFGATAKYVAFRWQNGLVGIEDPDPVTLSQLYCLDRQKEILTENTEAFLSGHPANNVLLYGNSGCGKSSMVKALLNTYHEQGLRLVQMGKEDLAELPLLLDTLKAQTFRYLVFMDDLSFEGNDDRYKALKTILEGGLACQPSNVLFYATSNRFHLVSETWEERRGEDIHVKDTQNEKLSLSERFGIRISFLAPAQNDYLRMIEGILADHGIAFTQALRTEALQWAVLYNGRSGRTATQFAKSILAREAKA
ncbi:MAG: ATP-binding protein [Ruminococcaceae bacterium]|nr:ATP-binding protein [Oscillospiraceae bacterium]